MLTNAFIKKPYILVCIEEINKIDNTVIFDFADSNQYADFVDSLNIEYDLEKPTMVILKNFKQKRRLLVNTYYSIDLEVIKLWINQFQFYPEGQSHLIGFIFDVKNFEKEIFGSTFGLKKLDD